MRKALSIAALSLAAACGGAASVNALVNAGGDTNVGTATGNAGQVPAGSAPDPWTGHYTGPLDGASGVLDIAPGGGAGDYAVSLSMGRAGTTGLGCVGGVSGTGRVTGDRMSFMAPIPEESLPNYNGEQCRIDLTRNGQSVRVEATYACTYHHGSSCAFDGTLRKTAARTRRR